MAAARLLARLSALVSRATAALCVAIIFVMLGLLAAQVFLRYAFGAPPSWTEEAAIMLCAWLVLLYATVGVRERFHVAIDLLPAGAVRVRRISDRLVGLVIAGFGGTLLWAGWIYVERTGGQRSAALQAPIEVLHAAAPVCGALLAFHGLALALAPAGDLDRDSPKADQVPLP